MDGASNVGNWGRGDTVGMAANGAFSAWQLFVPKGDGRVSGKPPRRGVRKGWDGWLADVQEALLPRALRLNGYT